jgi:hypothetical protein
MQYIEHDAMEGEIDMLRAMSIGLLAALGLAAAPISAADTPTGEQDVPNMQSNAVFGGPCDNTHRYIFGRAPNGQALACVLFDGAGTWVLSSPLHGVQQIGDSCSGDGAAQSPDGRALMCMGGEGWQPGP